MAVRQMNMVLNSSETDWIIVVYHKYKAPHFQATFQRSEKFVNDACTCISTTFRPIMGLLHVIGCITRKGQRSNKPGIATIRSKVMIE
jgi:hypothetical protein